MRSQLFTTCNIVSIICGLFMIFSSIGVYLVSNAIINYNIHKNVMIQEDSPAYKFWLNPPASIYRKYYLFHVENPSEIEKGERPILKERGPYTYREVWEKRHIEFLGHEALRFTPVITLFFERNMSIGDESDLITFLNVPAISMIEVASKMQSKEFVPAMVDDLLRLLDTKLFLTKTVGELISGYQDPLMALAKLFLPEVIKDDKFSLINGKNGTEWQNYSINTGYDYASEVAKIITWDGKEKLDYWNTPNANLINGTDGTFYSPFRTKDQRLYAFSPDMCRSYSLTYLKDNEIDGIKTMDFHLPRTMFYNASYNPDNEGFCDGNCLGNGVLNISQCYGGASGFISQPHFLNAEKQFTDAVEGMAPDENKHDFVLHFEPTTGVPISGNIRLMISFYMFQNEKIELVKNVKPVLFPMVWFDDDLHLDRDTRNQLAQVALYVNISFYSPIVMASVGVLTLMIHFTIVAVRWLRSKNSSSPPNENTSLINPNINSEE